MSNVEVAPQVTVENDTLTVTVERQVALYGDHTTVRAHVSTGFAPADEGESVEQYQSRIRGAAHTLALPLKLAVLSELGLDFEVVNGIVLEAVATQTDTSEPAPAKVYRQEYPTAAEQSALSVKEWQTVNGRNSLVNVLPSAVPAWVQPEAQKYEWAAEVIHGTRRDGKGDYWKVTDGTRNGQEAYINAPKGGAPAYSASDNEPF